jgi:stress response protein YsnF
MSHTVIGIFDDKSQANNAVQQLVNNGLSQSNIDSCSNNFNSAHTSAGESHSTDNNAFTNFFGSVLDKDDEARKYSDVASRGCTVTVHASSREEAEMAAEVLDRFGAVDVDERAEQYRGNNLRNTTGAATSDSNAIPVIEEALQVGKRVVQTGGVRLRSRIIEKQVEKHLRLREEHVSVERNPVNRIVSPADLDNFREETFEVTEKAEVPIVNKDVRVVEELHLSKEVEERDEVIRDSVRHTEVEVENFAGDSSLHSDRSDRLNNRLDTTTGVGTGLDTDTDANYLDKSHQNWTSTLTRMKAIEDDYKVASDDPDVRGWDVLDSTGNKIGEVDELIVDTDAMKVRYLEVDVDNDLFDVEDDHHILIPIGSATLDHSSKNVMVPTLDKNSVASYPAYRGETISRDYENGLLAAFSPGYNKESITNERFYEGEHFDSSRFSGSRKL